MSAKKKVEVQVIIPGLASPRVQVIIPVLASPRIRPPIEPQPARVTRESSRRSRVEALEKSSSVPKSIEIDPIIPRDQNLGLSMDSNSRRSSTQEPWQPPANLQQLFAPPQAEYTIRDPKPRSNSIPQLLAQRIMTSASPAPSSAPTSYASNESTPPEQNFVPPAISGPRARSQETRTAEGPARKKRKPNLSISLPPNPLLQPQPSTTTPLVLPQVPMTSNPNTSRNRRVQFALPKAPLVAPTQPAWYEGYQLTGTEEDIPYLNTTWMKIEDADIHSFLRRFHRYTRGSGDSAISSPESNDTEATLDGIMALLTKWQTVHQTRLNVTQKDCNFNGARIGQHICMEAFKLGYDSILQMMAQYFDTMVRSCEQQYRALPLSEQEDFQKYGDQSWMGCLQMDWNFFSGARDKIIELCREEIRRRNNHRQVYGVPPSGLVNRDGEIVGNNGNSGLPPSGPVNRNGPVVNNGISAQSTPGGTPRGGNPKKAAWNEGSRAADIGEFPNIISSELRHIPSGQRGLSRSVTPDGGAALNGAMDIDRPNSAVRSFQGLRIQPVVQFQPQGMLPSPNVSSFQRPRFQSPVQGYNQTVAQKPIAPARQSPRIQIPVVPAAAVGSFGLLVPTPPASTTSTTQQPYIVSPGGYRTIKNDHEDLA